MNLPGIGYQFALIDDDGNIGLLPVLELIYDPAEMDITDVPDVVTELGFDWNTTGVYRALLRPDGTAQDLFGTIYPSLDAYVADCGVPVKKKSDVRQFKRRATA
jgi:hypothetical protein